MIRLINLWFALLGLGSNKLRSALTTLGVIIGVAAVIIIVSLGNGLRRSTEIQMEAWSAGTVEIRPGGMWGGPVMMVQPEAAYKEGIIAAGGEVPFEPPQPAGLTLRDVEALERLATATNGALGQVEVYGQVIYKGRSLPMGMALGVTNRYMQVYRQDLKYGRFFTEAEQESAAPVIVLDESFVKEVWGEDANPVGELLRMAMGETPQNYAVIGVLKSRQGMYGYSSRSILVPLRTAQLRLNQQGRSQNLSLIAVRVDARKSNEREYAVAQINTILRASRGLAQGTPEDYMIYDSLEYSDESARITNLMTLILSLIAGISLVVGSIGLMNIMLVMVSERTWEIGLRRAMGARQIDVMSQFLAEAALLSLVGGAIGLGIGIAGSYAASQFIEQIKGLVTVTPDVVGIAVGISAVVGIASGLYPAWRASRLQPTRALRHGT